MRGPGRSWCATEVLEAGVGVRTLHSGDPQSQARGCIHLQDLVGVTAHTPGGRTGQMGFRAGLPGALALHEGAGGT